MIYLLIFSLLASPLLAEEVQMATQTEETDVLTPEEQEISEKPVSLQAPKNDNERQNWLVAGGSLIAAVVAIFVVSLNQGDSR